MPRLYLNTKEPWPVSYPSSITASLSFTLFNTSYRPLRCHILLSYSTAIQLKSTLWSAVLTEIFVVSLTFLDASWTSKYVTTVASPALSPHRSYHHQTVIRGTLYPTTEQFYDINEHSIWFNQEEISTLRSTMYKYRPPGSDFTTFKHCSTSMLSSARAHSKLNTCISAPRLENLNSCHSSFNKKRRTMISEKWK
jgi:hypothetical protein